MNNGIHLQQPQEQEENTNCLVSSDMQSASEGRLQVHQIEPTNRSRHFVIKRGNKTFSFLNGKFREIISDGNNEVISNLRSYPVIEGSTSSSESINREEKLSFSRLSPINTGHLQPTVTVEGNNLESSSSVHQSNNTDEELLNLRRKSERKVDKIRKAFGQMNP